MTHAGSIDFFLFIVFILLSEMEMEATHEISGIQDVNHRWFLYILLVGGVCVERVRKREGDGSQFCFQFCLAKQQSRL